VRTGKLKFGDFARSIIQDLTAMIIKQQLFNALKNLGGGEGGFGSGIIGGIKSFLGFADGGRIPTDGPVLVGERGPELISGAAGRSVTPNGQVGGGGPVTNNYITNNIQAVDGASVAKLFADNRKSLLGTVEQAKKELPTGARLA
jgi:hypothetical protein